MPIFVQFTVDRRSITILLLYVHKTHLCIQHVHVEHQMQFLQVFLPQDPHGYVGLLCALVLLNSIFWLTLGSCHYDYYTVVGLAQVINWSQFVVAQRPTASQLWRPSSTVAPLRFILTYYVLSFICWYTNYNSGAELTRVEMSWGWVVLGPSFWGAELTWGRDVQGPRCLGAELVWCRVDCHPFNQKVSMWNAMYNKNTQEALPLVTESVANVHIHEMSNCLVLIFDKQALM